MKDNKPGFRFSNLFTRAFFIFVFVFINVAGFPTAAKAGPLQEILPFATGLAGPFGMAFDADRNLYVANEDLVNASSRITKITPGGSSTTFGDGLWGAAAVAFNSMGDLYVASEPNRISSFNDGIETIFNDGGILNNPNAIAFDSDDNLYVLSTGGYVSKYASGGALIESSLAGGFSVPQGIVVDNVNGFLYISDNNGNIFQVNKDTGDDGLWAATHHSTNGGLVYGTATADEPVSIWLHKNENDPGWNYPNVQTNADVNGDWVADFGFAFDNSLWPGARVYDADNDETFAEPYFPTISVQPDHQWIRGNDWPCDSTVTVTVDDENPNNGVLYTDSQVAHPWFGNCVVEWHIDGNSVDLLPGQHVTLTDGARTKTMQIRSLVYDTINLETGISWGSGPAGESARLTILDNVNGFGADITFAPDGSWYVDFGALGYDPSRQGVWDSFISLFDQDGDETMAHWGQFIPLPLTLPPFPPFASGLIGPFGMDFDAQGNLYVANENWGMEPSHITQITTDGTPATFTEGFWGAAGVAFNSAGILHVSDDSNRVFRLDSSGNSTVFIDDGNLSNPNAIAFDSTDNLYVLNAGGYISKYIPDGSLVSANLAGGFNTPQGIVVDDAAGLLYISDWNGNIFQVDKNGGEPALWLATGHRTDGGLARNAQGDLFLSAIDIAEVIRISAVDKSITPCVRGFDRPRGLAFDSAGRLYVTEYNTGNIYRFDHCSTDLHLLDSAVVQAGLKYDWIQVRGFRPNTPVTVSIYNTAGGALLYSAEWTTGADGNLWLNNYDHNVTIKPGVYIEVFDEANLFSKSLIAANLKITLIDYDSGLVYGTAPAYETVSVWLHKNEYDPEWEAPYVQTTADVYGDWVADFGFAFDNSLWPGARVYDADNDETFAEPLFPRIIVQPNHQWIQGMEWQCNKTVFLTVDDNENLDNGGILYEDSQVAYVRDGALCGVYWEISGFDLQSGQYVTLTDGILSKTMRIEVVTFDQFDLQTGVASGTGPAGKKASIALLGTGAGSETIIEADGAWQVTLTGYNMQDAWDMFVTVPDEDDDETMIHYDYVVDWDLDGFVNWEDNAPFTYNPDLSDLDGDGIGDVADPCPFDATDTCNQDGSAAISIGTGGGELTTPDESTNIIVPPAALPEDTSISITAVDLPATYVLGNGDESSLVYGIEIGPPGTQFSTPITVTMSWPDSDNDGIVDGTGKEEAGLLISKNGIVITAACAIDPGCDQTLNTFSVQVSSLSEFALVILTDIAPEILSIEVPVDPVQIGTPVTITAPFIDLNIADTLTAAWDWGDGTAEQFIISGQTISTEHIYGIPGVYTLTLILTDRAGLTDEMTYSYVVAYDPAGGLVTGGGWIASPAGAYTSNPALSGKAAFGFVSKYQKGAHVPTGTTEFQFKTADLTFKSSSYQWLVIAGKKAMFKGEGAINGEGQYGFMLSAIDGNLKGGDGLDKFRIKIWDLATDTVIYDNQLGALENADPATVISGGSIVIHSAK